MCKKFAVQSENEKEENINKYEYQLLKMDDACDFYMLANLAFQEVYRVWKQEKKDFFWSKPSDHVIFLEVNNKADNNSNNKHEPEELNEQQNKNKIKNQSWCYDEQFHVTVAIGKHSWAGKILAFINNDHK